MKPLTKLQRNTLFISLVIAFLILSPWILLNSFGYKLDDALSIVKTGGLYVHSETSNASIYINGEYIKDNGPIIRNVLVQKLKPNQKYKVEFHKEGFQSWIKTIYVYSSLVSEGHVLMLPKEIDQEEIFPFFDTEGEGSNTPVAGFTKIQKTLDGKIIPENKEYIEVVTLFEGENPFEAKVPEVVPSRGLATSILETKLPQHYIDLEIKDPELLDNLIETSKEISWIHNGDVVLYWIDEIDAIPYYYCGGEKERICNNEILLDWSSDIKKFDYLPGRNDVWVILNSEGIYAVEIDPRSQRNIQPVYMGQNLDFEIDDSGEILVKDKGSFIKLDL